MAVQLLSALAESPLSLLPPTSWSAVFHAAHSATRPYHEPHAFSVSHSLPSISAGNHELILYEAPDFVIGQHQAESAHGRARRAILDRPERFAFVRRPVLFGR